MARYCWGRGVPALLCFDIVRPVEGRLTELFADQATGIRHRSWCGWFRDDQRPDGRVRSSCLPWRTSTDLTLVR